MSRKMIKMAVSLLTDSTLTESLVVPTWAWSKRHCCKLGCGGEFAAFLRRTTLGFARGESGRVVGKPVGEWGAVVQESLLRSVLLLVLLREVHHSVRATVLLERQKKENQSWPLHRSISFPMGGFQSQCVEYDKVTPTSTICNMQALTSNYALLSRAAGNLVTLS